MRTSVMPEPTEVRRERQAQGMQLERNSNFNMGTDLGDRKSNSNMATDWGDRKSIQKTKMASGNTPRILVSPLLSIHEEEELMPKEPCATPSWEMFASTQYGVWRGVGAAYCPLAKMKPISRGDADEYLYDCRTCSTVEEVQGTNGSSIQRKTMWAVGNPNGEQDKREREELAGKDIDCPDTQRRVTADLNSVELSYDALMEEDVMERDPGLFFFEDGSYSKGTFLLFKEDPNNLNPTYKIEQCLVRGRHRRVRVVHNLEVEENRLNIKWHGVAVYEEEWMGPDPVKSISDTGRQQLSLFSVRQRTRQEDLIGPWKVLEVSASAVLPEESVTGALTDMLSYAYSRMEVVRLRRLPEEPVHYVGWDKLNQDDLTVHWLPGGITAYMHQKESGVVMLGVAWHDDGVNLVMERDYDIMGRVYEVRNKFEVKESASLEK